MLDIFVDADACPVKEETYRVALRYDLRVILVSNSRLRSPQEGRVEKVLVGDDLDAADDWIAEHVAPDDIAITADIPLAARCLEAGACVLGPRGKEFTEDSIGDALASREIMSELRDMGEMMGGPPPFQKKDRSSYLQSLDRVIQAIRRKHSS